jgi:hypothetical protein
MAQVVRELLQSVCSVMKWSSDWSAAQNLVQNYTVVSWTGGTLKASMRLEEEVPGANFNHSTVDNRSGRAVGRTIRLCFLSRIEARVVAFAAYDDRQLGKSCIGLCCRIHLLAGAANQRQFLVQNLLILTL